MSTTSTIKVTNKVTRRNVNPVTADVVDDVALSIHVTAKMAADAIRYADLYGAHENVRRELVFIERSLRQEAARLGWTGEK